MMYGLLSSTASCFQIDPMILIFLFLGFLHVYKNTIYGKWSILVNCMTLMCYQFANQARESMAWGPAFPNRSDPTQVGWLHYMFLGTDTFLRLFIGCRCQKKKKKKTMTPIAIIPTPYLVQINVLVRAQHPFWKLVWWVVDAEVGDKMAE